MEAEEKEYTAMKTEYDMDIFPEMFKTREETGEEYHEETVEEEEADFEGIVIGNVAETYLADVQDTRKDVTSLHGQKN